VVGVLRNGAGPTVLIRAELDALPVAEETGLPYASTATGVGTDGRTVPVMHACGHDLHLAAAVGAAAHLARERDSWRGTLLTVGQPAEETLQGAAALLDDGLYDRFGRPDLLLAQHAAPLPAGMVAHGAGAMTAGCVTVDVTVPGRGGHAATPHLCVDPVLLAATIVLRLQALVARQASQDDPVALTVGTLRAGHHAAVIADEATLGVTIRSRHERTLDQVLDSVIRTIRAACAAANSTRRLAYSRICGGPGHDLPGTGRPPGGVRDGAGQLVAPLPGGGGLPTPGRRGDTEQLLDARHRGTTAVADGAGRHRGREAG